MEKQLPADLVLKSVDSWCRWAYRGWALERDIEIYANGGPPPTDDPEFSDNIVPLGFAQSFMKRELAPLKDSLLLKPGVIDATLVTPALKIPERTLTIQTQVNEVLNKIVMPRLRRPLTDVAGRATVTGRAVLFRKSPNEIELKCGRIIHPPEASTDILDPEFREWAFPGQLTLRDVDGHLKNASSGKYGWSKAGLEQLKLWIMATEAQKYSTNSMTSPDWARTYARESWLEFDLTRTGFSKPVDVYWYFRKNGKITKDDVRFGGHEKLDLYCVSRFGNEKAVLSTMKDSFREKSYDISYRDDFSKHLEQLEKDATGAWKEKGEKNCNERLLFYMPDIFKSVEDHMILHIDDEAIAGEQKLAEVLGVGKMAMPKLAVTEQLLTSIIEGLAFGAQPNWTVDPAQASDEYMKQLQRGGGVRSGQAFPKGIMPMEKQNAFSGFSHAMGFVRMLDTATAADSASNNQGTFGGSQAEFAAQANAELAGKQLAVTSRLENWLLTLDKVVEMVGRTLCQPWEKMKPEFPCYYEAQRMRKILRTRYDIHEDEWDEARWDYNARRLAGNMMRQQSISFNTQMLQVLGPVEPAIIPHLVREIVRAGYSDPIAEQWLNPPEEVQLSQTDKARNNVAIAFVTAQAPRALPSDDPMIHARVAVEVLQGRIQAAQAAGTILPSELVGNMAIIQLAVQHIMKTPPNLSKPALEKLGEYGKMLQQIPVQAPKPEGAMTEKEMADAQNKSLNQQRLWEDHKLKKNKLEFEQMVDIKKLVNAESLQNSTEKSLAAQRAQTMVGIQTDLNDAEQSDDPLGIAG